jgi:hypothetical protein
MPMRAGRPAYGEAWGGADGADVRAALSLLALMTDRPWRGQVAAVDVSEYASRKRLALITKWNTRIVWGGAPGDGLFGEPSPTVKLGRLDELNRDWGQIDAGQRVVEVTGPMTTIDDSSAGGSP